MLGRVSISPNVENEVTCDSLVFLHGLNGRPDRTWRSDTFFWPAELDLQGARVMLFGYDADIFSHQSGVNTMRIRDIGSDLLGTLTNHRRALHVRLLYRLYITTLIGYTRKSIDH